MSKKELLEARRGARTHNLEIKSLTRYRLCQPGLSLLIDEVFQWCDKYKSFFYGRRSAFPVSRDSGRFGKRSSYFISS
jgi:hypothetical protein